MRILLFDIDGTLLITGGSGSAALQLALKDICGLRNGMEGIAPHGRTDWEILSEALQRNGAGEELSDALRSSLFSCYASLLEKEILSGQRDFVVLPGVREFLVRLSLEPQFLLGLATGNIEEGARIKLEHADLMHYFSFGGYGSDAENRTEVIEIALSRGREKIQPREPEAVFVIGDTPRDIIHGRQAGARILAVASGFYSLKELEDCQPDLAVESLEQTDLLLSFLKS